MKYIKSLQNMFFLKVLIEYDYIYFGVGFTDNAYYYGLPNCEKNNLYLGQKNFYKSDCIEISESEFNTEFDKFCKAFKLLE